MSAVQHPYSQRFCNMPDMQFQEKKPKRSRQAAAAAAAAAAQFEQAIQDEIARLAAAPASSVEASSMLHMQMHLKCARSALYNAKGCSVQVLQAPDLAPSTNPQLQAVNRPHTSASSQPSFDELMSNIASRPVQPSAQVSASKHDRAQ